MDALAAADLSYRYRAGEAALRGIRLRVAQGEMVALLGPNGSGKTTLIRLLAGLLAPGAGSATVLGREASRWRRRELARRVAVVHQAPSLLFPFTVGETVEMGRWPHLRGMGWPGPADRLAVARAMEMADVSHLKERRLDELSGGERQRVYLARALAQEAGILLMDEPVAHLDACHQYRLMGMLGRINAGEGRTVLVSLHDLNLACGFCHRVVVLRGGAVAADGTPEQVMKPQLIREVFGLEALVDSNPLSGRVRVTVGGAGGTGQQSREDA